ncbi:hypothetical protein FRC00_014487, partial [Tulasnella sp. 408]
MTQALRLSDADDLFSHVRGLFRLIDAGAPFSPGNSPSTPTISQESLGHFINTVAPGAY